MSRLTRAALALALAAPLAAAPSVALAAAPLTVVDQVATFRVGERDGALAVELSSSDYDGSDERSVDPSRAVLHVPSSAEAAVPHDDYARDADGNPTDDQAYSFYKFLGGEGDRYLRTAHDPDDGARTGNLVLGFAGSNVADGKRLPQLRLDAADPSGVSLYQDDSAVTGPDVEPYRALHWDSTRRADQNTWGDVYGPDDVQYAFGAFGRPGSYCLTVRPGSFARPKGPITTGTAVAVRVVVGDRSDAELEATPPCEQPVDQPTQPTDPDAPTVLTTSHIDLAGVLRGGGPLSLVLRKTNAAGGGDEQLVPFRDGVLALDDTAKRTVPAGAKFIGAAGTPTWRIPENYDPSLPWLGFGGELLKDPVTSSPVMRMTGVTGLDGGAPPGDVTVWNNGAGTSSFGPTWSTRQGLPQGTHIPPGSHGHRNWDFSAPGVYCIGFDLQLAGASGTQLRDAQQLTVAVGDTVDPAEVTPCGRSGRDLPVGVPVRTPAVAPSKVLELTSTPDGGVPPTRNRITTALTGDDLQTRLVQGDPAGPGTAHDPSDVVFRARQDADANPDADAGPVGRRLYSFAPYGLGGGDIVGFDQLGVEPAQLDGPLRWSIGGVRGPGTVVVRDNFVNRRVLTASQAAPSASTTLVPGRAEPRYELHLDRPGVYCVDMTWSGRRASDGVDVSDKATLTLVGGDTPERVTTCSRGQRATAPTAATTPAPTPTGPGSTRPASGRTVLRVGHVDVHAYPAASGMRVRVHDDRPTPAVDRDPAKVTMYAAPSSRTTIPTSSGFGFLGRAGAPTWVLPQTQDDRLLWPGYNLTPGNSGATAVRWTLDSVKGPGRFALFENEAFGTPKLLLTSTRRSSFDYFAHGHANWAFGAEGVYCLNSTFTGRPTGGSAKATLLVAVGHLDPATVTPADCGRTATQLGARNSPPAQTSTRPDNPIAAALHTAPPRSATPSPDCIATPVMRSRPSAAMVVSDGHFDLGSRVASGRLRAEIEDGRSDPPEPRRPEALVFDVGDKAEQRVPAGYGFLGRAGDRAWVIPQTQQAGVPWLGWNTQQPTLRAGVRGPVTFALTRVTGPGRIAVYTDGVFGGVQRKVFGTVAGFPRSFAVPLNVHAHANWAFTKPGVYRLTITQTAGLAGGTETASSVLTIAVGQRDASAAAPSERTVSYVGRTATGGACTLSPEQRRLAATGADLTTALGTGAALLAAALVLLVAGRRRRARR